MELIGGGGGGVATPSFRLYISHTNPNYELVKESNLPQRLPILCVYVDSPATQAHHVLAFLH